MSDSESAPTQREKYGAFWTEDVSDLQIEITCIRNGGQWESDDGTQCGKGLFHHHLRLQKMLYPGKAWHRWNLLLLEQFCYKKFIGIAGAASTGKTRESADWAVANYICFFDQITVIASSTDLKMLERRIWGAIKRAWTGAKKLFPAINGRVLNSDKSIVTEDWTDGEIAVRDFINGIVCIPSVVGGEFKGLGKFVGLKNNRIIQIADELQFMQPGFLDAISNLAKNPFHQCIGIGNPKDREDVLGKLCEPSKLRGGWDGYEPSDKTQVWDTVWPDGVCVNLVGTDSPNFDTPEGEPVPYPYLITRKQIQADLELFGKESWRFEMFNQGVFPESSSARRIFTRQLCEQHRAMEEPMWDDKELKHFGSLDAAYGSIGGDRCVFMEWAMGRDVDGRLILAQIGPPFLVPVSGKKSYSPEDQISHWCKRECEARGISPEYFGFDSTGRGSLVSSLAKIWSPYVVTVEFGGPPTDRQVSKEIKVACKDYYVNFVSELWYQFRNAVEAKQIRGLTANVIEEGCLRGWSVKALGKIQVEPKDECRVRMGRSPDLMDAAVVGLEIARRNGFEISNLNPQARRQNMAWLYNLKTVHRQVQQASQLNYN